MTAAIKRISYLNPTQDKQTSGSLYLGPAQVSKAAGNRLQLELADKQVWAVLAIAYPYQPEPGDTVLVISQDKSWYVIGILNGTGKMAFTAPADMEFKAPRGAINFISAKGFHIRSSGVKIVSDEIELLARRISEKFDSARRWVKEIFQLRAGRARTIVDSTYRLKAKRIVERAKGDVKIDGRKIHLG